MRNALILLTVLALTACTDEIEKKEVLPTAPRKAAVVASPVAALKFDTSKASSICKASVRAGASSPTPASNRGYHAQRSPSGRTRSRPCDRSRYRLRTEGAGVLSPPGPDRLYCGRHRADRERGSARRGPRLRRDRRDGGHPNGGPVRVQRLRA